MNNSLVAAPTDAAVSDQALEAKVRAQLILPMFTQHEIAASVAQRVQKLKQAEKRAEKANAKWIQQNPKAVKVLEAYSDTLFDQSFGFDIDHELSNLGDPFIAEKAGTEEPQTEEIVGDWSDAAIEQLHEGLVMYSLRLLKATGNGKEKKEILRWIFFPESMAVEVEDAAGNKVWKAIPPASTPFSFELGCRICGYNPDKLREELSTVLKRLGLDALLKEINDADDLQRQQRHGAALGSIAIKLPADFGGAGHPRKQGEGERASV